MILLKNITAFVVGLLMVAGGAFGTPSTQIWIPSTDIQSYLNPHLGWDIYQNAYGDGLVSNGGITVGVLPFKKVGMEIGVDYRDINGTHANPIYFNAKIGLPEDGFFQNMPAFAIGGYDFGLKKNLTSYNLVYGLVAKTFGKIGRLAAGGYKGAVGVDAKKLFFVASKGYDTITGNSIKVDDVGFLASWDRTLREISDKLWIGVDFQSGDNGYGAASVGLAWSFSPNTSVILGYDFYNDIKALKPTFTLQFDVNVF